MAFRNYELKRLKKLAKHCQRGTVLDLGYSQNPNPYLPAGATSGLDLNKNETETKYGEELIGNVRFLEQSIGERVFDNIIAGELIEHLEEPYQFLRSLQKHLSRNGKLLISTPNPVGWPCIFFEWVQSKRFYYTQEHLFYLPPRWVRRILEKTGYTEIHCYSTGLLLPVLSPPCPTAFSYQVIYTAKKSDFR